jgi:hypothetical protein
VISDACQSCGARPVGDPLPRPEHQLPSFGRSLVLAVTGALMVLVFLTQTISALFQISARSVPSTLALSSIVPPLDFWTWLAAAETAAWRLKWIMIPLSLLVFFGSRKLYRSIQQAPLRFCALRYARRGYLASAAVPLLVLTLIGVTVPGRLQHRQWSIEAAESASIHRIDRAFDEYRETFATLPKGDPKKDLSRLPDPDGSLAEALNNLDLSGYRPTAEFAAVPNKKPQQLRGGVIRNASISTADDAPSERLSFTNYELTLPGPDKILGTEDDLLVKDGVIYNASESPRRGGTTGGTIQPRRP